MKTMYNVLTVDSVDRCASGLVRLTLEVIPQYNGYETRITPCRRRAVGLLRVFLCPAFRQALERAPSVRV